MSNALNRDEKIGNKMFIDLPTAAALAGFSNRHFRRIIEEKKIRTMRVGRKFFILGSDFTHWNASRSEHKR